MGLPHVRGGVSARPDASFFFGRSSPRAWGCFPFVRRQIREGPVFPTCVGVFPKWLIPRIAPSCLPHVRGGVSWGPEPSARPPQSSPRAWGCFFRLLAEKLLGIVFPTCVGVFR